MQINHLPIPNIGYFSVLNFQALRTNFRSYQTHRKLAYKGRTDPPKKYIIDIYECSFYVEINPVHLKSQIF